MCASSTPSWTDAYRELAETVAQQARATAPILSGQSACVDELFPVDAGRLARLKTAATSARGSLPQRIADAALARVVNGHGGELLYHWAEGAAWIRELLGEPSRTQVGGTGPQASWALAAVGATSVLALQDRSAQQLAVIDQRTLLCERGELVSAGEVTPAGEPTKQSHCILEFTAGTPFGQSTVPRSNRVILRFGDEPIEQDDEYLELTPAIPGVRAALISGMNGLRLEDAQSREWLADLSNRWRDAGVAVVHHEMAEYATLRQMENAVDSGVGTSLGISLSELHELAGSTADPAHLAVALAERSSASRVVVHADQWSLAVYRSADEPPTRQLLSGNLFAAARARCGHPVADLRIAADATFTDDLPDSGRVRDGWSAVSVPSPYMARPAATIGLGDTFVAGVLLGESLVAT